MRAHPGDDRPGRGPGAGGGGGGAASTSTQVVALSQPGAGNVGPRGQAALTSDATRANRSVAVQLTNVHLPDGTALAVAFADNGLILPDGAWASQPAGTMVVVAGAASGSAGTANGGRVPVFGTNGEITASVLPGPGMGAGPSMNGVHAFGGGR